MENSAIPKCQKCNTGDLVPLSDFGSQGAAIHYKAWVCTNPDCGFNIKIRNGDVYLNEPITSGACTLPGRDSGASRPYGTAVSAYAAAIERRPAWTPLVWRKLLTRLAASPRL